MSPFDFYGKGQGHLFVAIKSEMELNIGMHANQMFLRSQKVVICKKPLAIIEKQL